MAPRGGTVFMNIYGIDFTSAPRSQKPITFASGWFNNNTLTIQHLKQAHTMAQFNCWLYQPDPYVMAIDFPFSLPHDFLRAIDWPLNWESVIQRIESMTIQEFEEMIHHFKASQPPGKKHRFRPVDRIAQAQSPMCMHYTPVGRMFFRGAPYLYHCPASILPLRPRQSSQIIVEGYPALVARFIIGKVSYKSDTRARQTANQQMQRCTLIEGLQSQAFQEKYGFKIDLSNIDAQIVIKEKGADQLDAILCAIQAAWSYRCRDSHWGIPNNINHLPSQQGWIPDPNLYIDDETTRAK